MNRFRPNIVVAAASGRPEDDVPFAEDTWGLVQIGAHQMHVVKPCTRCKLTTVDQVHATVALHCIPPQLPSTLTRPPDQGRVR
jgi:uncharacterized protein YcbX